MDYYTSKFCPVLLRFILHHESLRSSYYPGDTPSRIPFSEPWSTDPSAGPIMMYPSNQPRRVPDVPSDITLKAPEAPIAPPRFTTNANILSGRRSPPSAQQAGPAHAHPLARAAAASIEAAGSPWVDIWASAPPPNIYNTPLARPGEYPAAPSAPFQQLPVPFWGQPPTWDHRTQHRWTDPFDQPQGRPQSAIK
jgi:hypothetical protein